MQSFVIMADLTFQNPHAGSIGDVELKILSEAVSLPKSKGLGVLPIVAAGDEGIAHPECGRHMPCQGGEEINACGGSSPDHDRTECFLCNMPFGDVPHQANHTYNLAFRVEVRGESAGFPNIASSRGMHADQNIRDIHYFALQCSFKHFFNPALAKRGEHFRRRFAEKFHCRFAGQPLHERVENLVAQFGVVNDDAFSGALDDFLVELVSLTQGLFVLFMFGHVP